MSLTASDVEMPQEQEPLNPDVAALPAKPRSRRTLVLMAVGLGVVAIFGTMAVLGNGVNKHDAHMNHSDRIQLLKRYAKLRNKKFAPLFLRHLTEDDDVPFPPEISETCQTKLQSMMEKGFELLGKALEACLEDEKSDECKDAEKALEDYGKKMEEDCKKNGEMCTLSATDKNGEEKEEMCVPSECHDDMKALAKFAEEAANHEEHGIDECKDFDCKASFECE